MFTLISKRRSRSMLALLAAAMLLAGCATQALHNKGLEQIQEGQMEEGLAKLEAASVAEPGNPTYRADLLRSRAQVVNRLMANASAELAVSHYDAAQAIYERILRIDKGNRNASLAIETLAMNKRHDAIIGEAGNLLEKEDFDSARTVLRPVLLENPKNSQAVTLLRQIDEQQNKAQMAEPSLLRKFKKPVSLQFRDANVKMVFEALSRLTGINVLLDKDIRPDIKTSIFVKDVSVEDAVDLILMQSQLEKKILSDNTLYIYPNTPAKTKDFQDLKIRSFHLVNADPKAMMTIIKTLLKTKDIVVNEKTNSIVMRDTPDAIHLAEKLVADQDIADPEVMLEVEVLEISRSRLSEIGAKFPSQLSFTAGVTTLKDLQNVSSSMVNVNPAPSITLNAMLQDSDTNILSSPRLRVRNREKAKIMIGERVPIITNSITPSATAANGGIVTGTVTYQDVGLKLEVEPDIHLDNEVTIKVGLEVSSLGLALTNSAGSVVYRIGTRNTATALRLRDGETQILAGLITDDDRSTVDKVPALGQIPLLGRLFASDNSTKSKTEIILSITPHLVGNAKLADARETEYWSGTESTLHSSQLTLKRLGAVTLSNSATAPAPMPAPYVPSALPAANSAPLPTAALPAASAVPAAGAASAASAAPPLSAIKNAEPAAASMALAWQGPTQAKVGEKITLSLNTQSAQGLKTVGLQIGFDPEVLKVIDVNEGDALKRGTAQASMTKHIDQTGGGITVDLTGAGAASAGSIVTLTFEVMAAAQGTSVSVDAVSATDANGGGASLAAPEPYVIALTQ
jgi:general secretion pathway protein D